MLRYLYCAVNATVIGEISTAASASQLERLVGSISSQYIHTYARANRIFCLSCPGCRAEQSEARGMDATHYVLTADALWDRKIAILPGSLKRGAIPSRPISRF